MINRQHAAASALAVLLGWTSWGALAQPRASAPVGPVPHGYQHPGAHPAPPPPPAAAHRPGPSNAHPHGMPPGQAQRMGAGPDHQWVKGSRVPKQYRTQHYVVQDWQRHGLKRPGRGQQWVQYGGDYLLVAAATGIIAQLVLGH